MNRFQLCQHKTMEVKTAESVPLEIGVRIFTRAVDSGVQGRMEMGVRNFSSVTMLKCRPCFLSVTNLFMLANFLYMLSASMC